VMSGAPLVGWGKPVFFNSHNLSRPRRDSILIAIAGPISNILQALVWLALLCAFQLGAEHAGVELHADSIFEVAMHAPSLDSGSEIIAAFLIIGVLTNFALAVFNMIPIPPLDGHYILEALGPPSIGKWVEEIRPYSFFIFFALIWFRFLQPLMNPFMEAATVTVYTALESSL